MADAVAPNRNRRPAGRVRAERSVTLAAGVASSVASGVWNGARIDDANDVAGEHGVGRAEHRRVAVHGDPAGRAVGLEGGGLCGAEQGLEGQAVAAGHLDLDLGRAGPRSGDGRSTELVGDASNVSAGGAGEGEARDCDCERRCGQADRAEHGLPFPEVSVHVFGARYPRSHPEVRDQGAARKHSRRTCERSSVICMESVMAGASLPAPGDATVLASRP